jgi:hypothetical protein
LFDWLWGGAGRRLRDVDVREWSKAKKKGDEEAVSVVRDVGGWDETRWAGRGSS